MPKLILMRGASSAGKSTIARELVEEERRTGFRAEICSTDDFFLDAAGQYCFDATKLPENHEKNRQRVRGLMIEGVELIVVDNTNIAPWEFAPYLKMAEQFGYNVERILLNVPLKTLLERNAARADRKWPERVIRRMYEKLQRQIAAGE